MQFGKRVYHSLEVCAGHIPTEIGRLIAMTVCNFTDNKLAGRVLIAHQSRIGKRVSHSRQMCAGHIPTEIGQLTAMTECWLYHNQLTGRRLTTHKSGLVNEFTIVETALTRSHPNRNWALPPVERPSARGQSADWFVRMS